MDNISIVGIDLAKKTFHLVGLDQQGNKVLSKKLYRADFLSFIQENIQTSTLLVMEACSTCHHWAREFQALGFSVKLLKPKDVKPFTKTKRKNDANDALAIARAGRDPELKAVTPKTIDEQEASYIHQRRADFIRQRIRIVNQTKGMLAEFGYIPTCSSETFRKQAAIEIQKAFDQHLLPPFVYQELILMAEQIVTLLDEEKRIDKLITSLNKKSKKALIALTIPGIGPINAHILSVQPTEAYDSGRDFSASLGLVPSQHSSGQSIVLGRITKQGNRYIRTMLIQGGRSVLIQAMRTQQTNDKLILWAKSLLERMSFNKAAIAVANKLARIAYSCMQNGTAYRPV